jgi:AraC family transcriptional regulator of adaptative response/methylated-DNA-[protein]-cysteine methyltransferase
MTVKPASFELDPLDRALALLDASDAPLRLPQLAKAVGLSPSHLQRAFRRRFGVSPAEYVQSRKLRQLKAALREAPRVTDAIYDAGYGSGSRVYEKTGQLLGMTPADYKRAGTGVAIRYTTLRTAFGALLVAASERGICAVTLGDSESALIAGLGAEFAEATLQRVDDGRDEWLAATIARVAAELGSGAPQPTTAVPVDVRATAFQWRVWQALQHIPRGQTRSYQQIAAAIGAPRAVRAVANACANNRLAVVVPCHRVVRADGSLGGYRWGIARKRALLECEAKVAP